MNISNLQKQYADVVFLDYINRRPVDINCDYPTYLKEELQISDSTKLVKKLIKNGYVAQKDEKLVLTKNGVAVLRENEDLARFFELGNLYVSIQDYAARKALKPQKSFELLMIELLREKGEEYKAKDDFEAVRRLHFDIARLYEEADYPVQALHHYLLVLYFDVSGLEYYDILLRYIKGKCKRDKLMAKYDFIYIRPEVQAAVGRLKDYYDDEIVEWIYKNNGISINLCNKKHFIALVTDIMNGTYSEIEWQKYFRKVFVKIVASIKDSKAVEEKK